MGEGFQNSHVYKDSW